MNSQQAVRIRDREGIDALRCRNCNRQLFYIWYDDEGESHAFWCWACDRN